MKNIKSLSQLKLIFSVCLIGYVEIFVGGSAIFSAVLLGQLQEPNSSLKVNANEASWIASISSLICPLGLLITGALADKIGRKKALHVTYITILLSWSIFAFCNSYEAVLVGKILQGFTFGANTVSYMYVGEICHASQRSLFVSLVTLMVGVGMTSQCVLAVFFHWHTIAGILFAASAVGCASLFLVPESPAWLRTRNRVGEAEAAEEWFGTAKAAHSDHSAAAPRANAFTVDQIETTTQQQERHESSACTDTCADTLGGCRSLYAHRTVWLPTLVMLGFFACQEASGYYVLMSYSPYVLRDFGVRWDGMTVTAVFCAGRVAGSLVFSALHRVKRKTLTVVSGVGMATSLVITMASKNAFPDGSGDSVNVVPVTAFVAYVFFAMLGLMPLPWIFCSEVFPTAVKGTMNGFILTCQSLMTFTVIKIYPMVVLNLGVEVVWSIFSIVCVFSALYGVFVLPETKGKSLEEIMMSFESRGKATNSNNS